MIKADSVFLYKHTYGKEFDWKRKYKISPLGTWTGDHKYNTNRYICERYQNTSDQVVHIKQRSRITLCYIITLSKCLTRLLVADSNNETFLTVDGAGQWLRQGCQKQWLVME